MNLVVTNKNLDKALKAVGGSIASKFHVTILSFVRLEAEDGGLWVTATNLDVTTRVRVPANTFAEGSATVPGKKLQEVSRSLPNADVFIRSGGEDNVEVECGASHFRLHTLPASDFPVAPDVDFGEPWRVRLGDLLDLAESTAFCASSQEHRPILNAAYWEFKDGEMVMAATNGHRLARRSVAVPAGQEEAGFLVLPGALAQLGKLFEHEDEDIAVAATGNYLAFRSPDAEMYTRLIEGKYPNYEQVIPKDNPITAVADSEELIKALRRMVIVASDPPFKTTLTLSPDGRLHFYAHGPDFGTGDDEVDVEYDGAEVMKIAFNARYLLDIAQRMSGGRLRISLTNPNRAVTIVPDDGSEDYLCLAMPLRIS